MLNKKAALAALTIGCVSSLNASLIDLTPGGFNWNNPPPVVTEWYANTRPHLLLYPTTWNFFQVTGLGTTEVTLTWNLPPKFTFEYLFVQDQNSNVDFLQVPFSPLLHRGTVTVTFNTPIMYVTPFGRYNTPDTGSAILLFGLSLLALLGLRYDNLNTSK